jgi:hypothetical protein
MGVFTLANPLLRPLVRLLGLLSGCGCAVAVTACYGVPSLPPPHDPTVVLQDFSYSPASPIHVGDTIQLTATLNHHTSAGLLQAVFKHHKLAVANLNDRGEAPDTLPEDGVYCGQLEWTAELGDGKDLRVYAELLWFDDYDSLLRDAAPLTILPTEEGQ